MFQTWQLPGLSLQLSTFSFQPGYSFVIEAATHRTRAVPVLHWDQKFKQFDNFKKVLKMCN